MKKTILLKSVLLLCALIAGSGSVWAAVATEDIVITSANLTKSSGYPTQAETTFDVNDFTFGYNTGVYRPTANNTPSGWIGGQVIQFKKNLGVLYNTTAINNITKIRIYRCYGSAPFTLYSGSSAQPTTNGCAHDAASGVTSSTETMEYQKYVKGKDATTESINVTYFEFDLSTNKPSYFKISCGDGTLYVNKIVITHEVNDVPTTISSVGWNTFSSPFALDFTGYTDANAYMVTNASGTTLTLAQVTGTVPANTGLLISGEAGDVDIPTAASSTTDVTANKLKPGTGAEINAADKYVLVASGGKAVFQHTGTNAATVPVGKAYLDLEGVSLSREFILDDSQITGISEVHATNMFNGAIYNLSGQRITKPGKGLYIVNGKKVIIK